jgi:hypothetical protein
VVINRRRNTCVLEGVWAATAASDMRAEDSKRGGNCQHRLVLTDESPGTIFYGKAMAGSKHPEIFPEPGRPDAVTATPSSSTHIS